MILIDQLEAVIGKGKDGYAWNAQGWYGGDIDRLWFKTEGESSFGERLESVEVQALWSRALDPWWNLQAGVRHDFRAGRDRKIGRAHVCTPVTNAHLVCRLLLEKPTVKRSLPPQTERTHC